MYDVCDDTVVCLHIYKLYPSHPRACTCHLYSLD